MNDVECPSCAAYLARRRNVLLPFVGRWVQKYGAPPERIVRALLRAAHRRHGGVA